MWAGLKEPVYLYIISKISSSQLTEITLICFI